MMLGQARTYYTNGNTTLLIVHMGVIILTEDNVIEKYVGLNEETSLTVRNLVT